VTTASQYGIPPIPSRKASGGVVALGVINIIYAVLFRLCCGGSLLLYALLGGAILKLAEMQKTQMPSLQMMPTGSVKAYIIISAFVLLILGILLLIGGIGLLTLKPWGRSLSIGVAAAEIVWVLVDFAINVFLVSPWTIQTAGEGMSQGPQMVGTVILQILMSLLKLAYPIILLICLNFKSIREQFEPSTGSQQTV
jgi:hypothetical protein